MAEKKTLFNPNYRCPICEKFHAIRQCTKFIVMDVEQKLRIVAQKSLCYNCLAQSHTQAQCKSLDRCYRCREAHHSWLHPLPNDRLWVSMSAVVSVTAGPGKEPRLIRAVIDPNVSTSRIMSTEAKLMGCRVHRGKTTIQVGHRNLQRQRITVECLVEEKTYGCNPAEDVDPPYQEAEEDARKRWYKRRPYHLILGADVQGKIFSGQRKDDLVVCGELHGVTQCNKSKTDSNGKKCSNCGANHTANYRGCPVYTHFKRSMSNKSSVLPKQSQQPPVISRINFPQIGQPNSHINAMNSKQISYANIVKSNIADMNQEPKSQYSVPYFNNLEVTLQSVVQSINTFTTTITTAGEKITTFFLATFFCKV